MLKQEPGVHPAGSCQRGEKPILPLQAKKPHGRRSGACSGTADSRLLYHMMPSRTSGAAEASLAAVHRAILGKAS